MTVESSSSSPRPSWRKEKVRMTDPQHLQIQVGLSSQENSGSKGENMAPCFLLADSEPNDLTSLQALFLFPSPGPKYLTGKICGVFFPNTGESLNPYYLFFFGPTPFSPLYLLTYLSTSILFHFCYFYKRVEVANIPK